jgi:pilus assembly protein CpaB
MEKSLPKINRNLLFIVVALVLGMLAALLAVNYVQKAIAERTRQTGETTTVAVPKQDMEVGAILADGDLAAREVPADLVPADAITPDNYQGHVGRALRAPVREGAPVAGSALVPLNEQFSSVIGRGKVGYTLGVDETNSISGMISPGDHVDLMLTVDQENTGARVVPLLEDVPVLATGNRVGESPQDEQNPGYSNITLELDPDQAERLAVGGKAGTVQVVLRHTADRGDFRLEGLTQKQLLGIPAVQTAGNSKGAGVEYIIGGGKG